MRRQTGPCRIVGWAPIGRLKEPIVRVPQFRGDFWIGTKSCLYDQLMRTGEFEPEQTKAVLSYLRADKDAIDVGANVGLYSVLLAKTRNDGRRALSIEPIPLMIRRLHSNLVLNKVDDRVILYQGAVLHYEGKVGIHVINGREEYSSTGEMRLPATAGVTYSTIDVPVTTIDALVKKHNIEPGFIKIDVEGREPAVLAGMTETIRKYHPVILTEFWPTSLVGESAATQDLIHNTLAEYGYSMQIVGGYDFLCLPNE